MAESRVNWGEVAMTAGIVLVVVAVALLLPSVSALARRRNLTGE